MQIFQIYQARAVQELMNAVDSLNEAAQHAHRMDMAELRELIGQTQNKVMELVEKALTENGAKFCKKAELEQQKEFR